MLVISGFLALLYIILWSHFKNDTWPTLSKCYTYYKDKRNEKPAALILLEQAMHKLVHLYIVYLSLAIKAIGKLT